MNTIKYYYYNFVRCEKIMPNFARKINNEI